MRHAIWQVWQVAEFMREMIYKSKTANSFLLFCTEIGCQPTMAGINCRSNFIVQAYRSLLCRWILKSNSILWILSVKVRRHVSSLHLSMTRRLALLACDLRLVIKYVKIKKKRKSLITDRVTEHEVTPNNIRHHVSLTIEALSHRGYVKCLPWLSHLFHIVF